MFRHALDTSFKTAAVTRIPTKLVATTQIRLVQRPLSTVAAHRRPLVLPSLRQRRPIVNGEAVAFNVRDLVPPASTYHTPTFAASAQTNGWNADVRDALQQRPKYESDLIVVLDMDECLIHSQFMTAQASTYAWQMHNKQQQRFTTAQQPWNKVNNNNRSVDPVESFRFTLPDGDLVHVNLRPGLDEFLEFCTSRFETHIFTAAMSVYADVILDRLDPKRTRFSGRWYREHCHYDDKQKAYVKKLDLLPLGSNNNNNKNVTSLDRVVLVDNNPLSFLCNPNNGILVSSFFNDPHDNTLPAVKKLLEELDTHNGSVKPILQARFGLEQALRDIGMQSQHHQLQ